MTEVLLFDKVMRPDEFYRACRLTPKQLGTKGDATLILKNLLAFKHAEISESRVCRYTTSPNVAIGEKTTLKKG